MSADIECKWRVIGMQDRGHYKQKGNPRHNQARSECRWPVIVGGRVQYTVSTIDVETSIQRQYARIKQRCSTEVILLRRRRVGTVPLCVHTRKESTSPVRLRAPVLCEMQYS